jgi:hypothetical protein
LRPSSILLIFDSEPRMALAASCAEMPRASRSRLNCVPSMIRSTVGAPVASVVALTGEARPALAGAVLPGAVLPGAVLPGAVPVGSMLAGSVLAGSMLAGAGAALSRLGALAALPGTALSSLAPSDISRPPLTMRRVDLTIVLPPSGQP